MGDYRQFTTDRQQPQQPAMSSGLARYQSAPSSYFASLMSNNISNFHQICDEFMNPSTPKTDQVFSTYMPAGVSDFMAAPIKSECETYAHDQQQLQGQRSEYSSASQIIHQNQSQPSMPNRSLPVSNPTMDSSYLPQMNTGGGRNTNLLRQSSSPAKFFSDFDIEGYNVSKSMGNFGPDKGSNMETSVQSPNRLKSQLDFPSGLPSSSGIMTPISEIENKNMEISGTNFPFTSWDDSDIFSDDFLRGHENDDRKSFASKNQNDGVGNYRPPTVLSHHLSLPKTSAKLSSMEKFLELQDSVPCKIRAKRGCATHPRSIAERVRRTRISERMRKLQELVPNMDKQTNTSDMLDLAVDYIKDLQDKVQTLSGNRANCTCSNQQTP